MKKPNNILATLIIIFTVSLVVSISLKLLGVINVVVMIIIPLIFLLFVLGYYLTNKMNEIKPIIKSKRPELEDLITPAKAWSYVKEYFVNNFGLRLKLSNDKSYMIMKTVGQEGYETKIFSFFAEHEGLGNIDTYHIVLQGHNPEGLLFLKNETDHKKINELEQGMARKSQLFSTETIVQEDELSGRRITKTRVAPVEEQIDKGDDSDSENNKNTDM